MINGKNYADVNVTMATVYIAEERNTPCTEKRCHYVFAPNFAKY